jgi:tetratricopeptide (TPR) repeat protein
LRVGRRYIRLPTLGYVLLLKKLRVFFQVINLKWIVMDLITGFLIYALLFRLAIIITGLVSIILGYRLFACNVSTSASLGNESNVHAQYGKTKLILSNVGSGTAFALFGASIIIAMLWKGSPELLFEDVTRMQGSARGGESVARAPENQLNFIMKGNGNDTPSEHLHRFKARIRDALQIQDTQAAIEMYSNILSESNEIPLGEAVALLNNLALLYRKQNRVIEAVALARVATTVNQKNPEYFDTLALILLDQGSYGEAEQAANVAVGLDPANQNYHKTLNRVLGVKKTGK